MKFFRLYLSTPFLLSLCLFSCKSSKVKQSDSNQQSTPTATQVSTDTLTNKDLGDMIKVSSSIRTDLENYFADFSKLDINDEENRQKHLEKGLHYFKNSDTPVLIVVNEVNGKAIYDRPTSIEKYLDYLKHTRQNPHTIHNFELDEMGKISKLELTLK